MAYPDPATTDLTARARWHIETAVHLQRESESTEPGSHEEIWQLGAARNHAAIASAMIALEVLEATEQKAQRRVAIGDGQR